MSDDINRTLGAHDADIAHLQRTVESLAADVRAIRSAVDQGTGGWKAIVFIGGIASTFGGVVGWILSHLVGKPGAP